MQDIVRFSHNAVHLPPLQRPAILMRAAVAGADLYRRKTALRRLLGQAELTPEQALPRLLAHEKRQEDERQSNHPGYSALRHVELLSAILAESRVFSVNLSTTSPFAVNNPAADPQLASGWAELLLIPGFPSSAIEVDTEQTFGGPQRFGRVVGLPLSGLAFRTMINANAQPGLLARYGGAWPIQRRRTLLSP